MNIKIEANKSKEHIMFVNKKSYKYFDILKVFNFNKIYMTSLEEDIDFRIFGKETELLINELETLISILLNSEDYSQKTQGGIIVFKGREFYLNTKSFRIDREITTLNSILKIASFCHQNNVFMNIIHNENF